MYADRSMHVYKDDPYAASRSSANVKHVQNTFLWRRSRVLESSEVLSRECVGTIPSRYASGSRRVSTHT